MILDLMLAGRMRTHPDLQVRLAVLGITAEEVRAELRAAKEAGLIRRHVLPADLIAHIGKPDRTEPDCLAYDLTLWPEHRFEFGIHSGGWILYRGFATRNAVPPIPRPTPLTGYSAKQAFEIGLHTIVHVQEALGPPYTRQGWNGMEDLFYTTVTRPTLVFEFDFGLLTGISEREPILLP